MTERGAPLDWLVAHVSYEANDCLAWPFSKYRNGYGQVWMSGRLMPAHRAMCLLAHGVAHFERAQAAHACGVRHCCNPRHLSWKTQSQNERDKRNHSTAQIGEQNGFSKLKVPQVSFIKALIHRGIPSAEIGRFFCVNRKTIDAIKEGRTWAFVLPEYDEWLPDIAAARNFLARAAA